MRHAVREVRSAGYTARDAGMLLGVSNQRISQIERSGGEKRSSNRIVPSERPGKVAVARRAIVLPIR